MAGKSCRYMVTVNDPKLSKFLVSSSKRDHKSISRTIMELMQEAMELREDYELSKIADEAWERNKDKPFTPAGEVWKLCDLR